VVQRALGLVVGADVVLGDVALLVLVDGGEVAGDGLVARLRLVERQMAVTRRVRLLEALRHRQVVVQCGGRRLRLGCRLGRGGQGQHRGGKKR